MLKLRFSDVSRCYKGLTGCSVVFFLGFTWFESAVLVFLPSFYRVIFLVVLGFTWYNLVVLGLTGFSLDLLEFPMFYLVIT